MALWRKSPREFPGGLAWPARRSAGAATGFVPVPPPERLSIPLPEAMAAKPVGTVLSAGEKVTESVHGPVAPLAGRVVGHSTVTLTDGRRVPAADLEIGPVAAGAADTPAVNGESPGDVRVPPEAGERRTSPDLSRQLSDPALRGAPVLVCNLVDHEPPLALNGAIVEHYADAVIAAAVFLRRHVGAKRALMAINEGDRVARQRLVDRARRERLLVVPLPERYPQGHPSLLLYTLLGLRVSPGALPSGKGVLLADGPALLATGNVVLGGAPGPLPVALYDHRRGQSHYLTVACGTPVAHVLRHLQLPPGAVALFAGDLMGRRPAPAEAVIGASELVLHVAERREAECERLPSPCARCGWCVEHCPTRLHPAQLLEAAQYDDRYLAADAGLASCVECGLCSYVCPSQLPLLAAIRNLKVDAPDGSRV
jgi:electron transport complex protein RnfC